MTVYFPGDRPVEALVIPAPVDGFTEASAALVKPSGAWAPLTATLEPEDSLVSVDWPADASPFTESGLYRVRLSLNRPATPDGPRAASERLQDVLIVVEADDGWHTLGSVRSEWADGRDISDHRLYRLLTVARLECEAYAPALPERAPVPENYREAQLLQTRNRWNVARVDPSGTAGADGFSMTPFPLDWQTRQLLRPKSGTPVVA